MTGFTDFTWSIWKRIAEKIIKRLTNLSLNAFWMRIAGRFTETSVVNANRSFARANSGLNQIHMSSFIVHPKRIFSVGNDRNEQRFCCKMNLIRCIWQEYHVWFLHYLDDPCSFLFVNFRKILSFMNWLHYFENNKPK